MLCLEIILPPPPQSGTCQLPMASCQSCCPHLLDAYFDLRLLPLRFEPVDSQRMQILNLRLHPKIKTKVNFMFRVFFIKEEIYFMSTIYTI